MVKYVDIDEQIDKIAQQTRIKNANKDVKSIIHAIMESPVNSKYGTDLEYVDGTKPLDQLKGKALDAQTMLLLNITNKAIKTGDVKLAEFLMKYGGYEPPKQQQLSVELPQFIEDIAIPTVDTRNIHAEKAAEAEEVKEKEIREVVETALLTMGLSDDDTDE